jgi:hypothetical protein
LTIQHDLRMGPRWSILAAFKLIRLPFIWLIGCASFEFHPAEIFPVLLPKRDSCERALWYPPGGSSRTGRGSSG